METPRPTKFFTFRFEFEPEINVSKIKYENWIESVIVGGQYLSGKPLKNDPINLIEFAALQSCESVRVEKNYLEFKILYSPESNQISVRFYSDRVIVRNCLDLKQAQNSLELLREKFPEKYQFTVINSTEIQVEHLWNLPTSTSLDQLCRHFESLLNFFVDVHESKEKFAENFEEDIEKFLTIRYQRVIFKINIQTQTVTQISPSSEEGEEAFLAFQDELKSV